MEGCAEDVLSCVHTVYYYYCTKGEYRDPLKQVKSTIDETRLTRLTKSVMTISTAGGR